MQKYITAINLIKYKPITPGLRHQKNLQKNLLSRNTKIIKKLVFNLKRSVGRSQNTGRITVRRKGGGCKKRYRIINFSNNFSVGIILSTAYDSYRNTFVSLIFDLYTYSFYNKIATSQVGCGSLVGVGANFKTSYKGVRTDLTRLSLGTIFHNISNCYNQSAKFVRSAGTYGQLIQKSNSCCKVRLPSNQMITLKIQTFVTLGSVDNKNLKSTILGKAGRNRIKGIRPYVRGIAMNPVDHPHGGRTNGGRPSVTPWGKSTKGKKTRKKK